MTYLAFLYFFLLTLMHFFKNNKRADLPFLIMLMYTINSFLSIFVDKYNMLGLNYHPSLLSTIVYCGLLTLCWLPFSRYSNLNINKVKAISNTKALKIVAWVSFLWFVIYLYLSKDTLQLVLTGGDMLALRGMIYKGESINVGQGLPVYLHIPFTLANCLFGCSWIFIFLAFFSKFIQKLPNKYFLLFLLTSLSGPLAGIVGVDRSKTTYWIISMVINFLFFSKFMTRKQRTWVMSVLAIFVTGGLIYIANLTTARFDDYDSVAGLSGSLSGVLVYLGQSYINFCYFFDTFTPPYHTLAIIFPSFYYFVLGDDLVGGTVLQAHWDLLTGYSTGVFYTFMGHIMIFAGFFVLVVFCVLYSTISNSILKRNVLKGGTLHSLFMYQALASVMALGLFGHYYASYILTFSLVFFYCFTKYLSKY